MLSFTRLVTVPDAQVIMFVENAGRSLSIPERKSKIGSQYAKRIDERERPARPKSPPICQPQ